jgi:hypothetical protein
MNKISLYSFFSFKILNAQTFMGITNGGTQENIKSKLVNKGFKLNQVEVNGTYILKEN